MQLIEPGQRVVIGMMDGLDMAYWEATPLPHCKQMATEGLFKEVTGAFPSVTNVNNVSICCGTWPAEHGIVANSYYDRDANGPAYMNAAEFILAPTLFARAKEHGIKSALLTCKRKTLELFRNDLEIGIAAEAASDAVKARYGEPADIYSREINYWLWTVAVDLLRTRPDLGILYVHITDYPMHAWGPECAESQEHLTRLDALIGEARAVVPDAAFLFTADHGMNYKTRCWDLNRVLAANGTPARFVLSPERDYYIKHHRNFTGCAWVWLESLDGEAAVTACLEKLAGVEGVLTRDEVAERYHLVPDLIGDLTVLGDRDTMFGDMESEYEDLPATYRAHGSLHEMRLPLLLWNACDDLAPEAFQYNLDLARHLYPVGQPAGYRGD